MSKTHVIDGKTYVEVDRKADAGDYVYISRINNDKVSEIRKIETAYHDYNQLEFREEVNGEDTLDYDHDGDEFVTLEPIVYEKPSHKLNDLISQIKPENKHEEWPPLTEESIELTANDIRWQPERVIDLLANLARRVSSLEEQLKDTQNNLVRQAEELEAVRYGNDELYRRIEGVEQSTASHRDELNVIDHEKAMIFEDIVSLSKRIRKLNITGGAAE